MNKKILTVIIIIATIVSVIFIFYPNNKAGSSDEKIQVRNNVDEVGENSIEKVDNSEEITEKSDNNENAENSEPLIKVQENNDSTYNKTQEESSNNYENKEYDSKEDTLTAAKIFKVDKNTIENKLSVSNKAKLLYYASKLSNFDYARIKDVLENGNEIDGAKDIVKILKSRLNDKDYEEVKKILEPYIDIDKIEEFISV